MARPIPINAASAAGIRPEATGRFRLTGCKRSSFASRTSLIAYHPLDAKQNAANAIAASVILAEISEESIPRPAPGSQKISGTRTNTFLIQSPGRSRRRIGRMPHLSVNCTIQPQISDQCGKHRI
ncbi:MAG: hypothetical protein NTY97_07465, partial [Planctomycetota bacterium]|nr:hypothetical protein [Planctomycetota bacterium]